MSDNRKALSLLLVLLMTASIVPAAGFAEQHKEPTIVGARPEFASSSDVVAWRTSTPITVDGVVDAKWADAYRFKAFATGASGNIDIYVRALFDDDNVYFLAQWTEPTPPTPRKADFDREPWVLTSNVTPGAWQREPWGEDRFSIMWADPDKPVANFTSQGCDGVCHNQLEMYTSAPGEMLDAWVWSAATSDHDGYADDGYLSTNGSVTYDPLRMHVTKAALGWDPGNDGWLINLDMPGKARPAYVWKDGITPANRSVLRASEAQQVDWGTFDVSTLAQGMFVPGHLIETPSGDRANIAAKGLHNGTGWTLEFKRARDTHSSYDVPFTKTNVPYYFSMSVTNNLTGENHSKSPQAYRLWLAEPVLPDLTIRTFSVIDDPASVNSFLRANVFVENLGWADAPATRLAYYWDARTTPEGYVDVPAIKWGVNTAVEVNWSTVGLSPGTHTLKVSADADAVVTEINETNNVGTKQVLLYSELLPDLTITAFNVTPSRIPHGSNVAIKVTVKNVGTKPATNIKVIAYLTDPQTPVATGIITSLSIGSVRDADMPPWLEVRMPLGNYTLNATVDPDDTIREANEGNNTASTAFEVVKATLPDLVILELDPASATVKQGEHTQATVKVKNVGDAAAPAGLEVALYLDQPFTRGRIDQVGTCATSAPLAAGAEWDAVVPWTVDVSVELGPHELRAHVNWNEAVSESNESNDNLTYRNLIVEKRPLPDLTVLSIDPAAPTAKLDTVLNVTVRVGNVGGFASQPTTLDVVDGTHNTTLSSIFVPAIGDHETAVVYFEWAVQGVQAGSIQLIFNVDPRNQLVEDNELNNTKVATLTVLPPDLPDLAIDGITFTPAQPRVGDGVTITVAVRNNGTKASVATTVEVRLGNNRIGTKDLGVLAPGGTANVDIVWPATEVLTPMRYVVRAVVDPTGLNRDPNPGNDELTAGVTFLKVLAPVLGDLNVTIAPLKVKVNGEVTVTVTIHNTGDAPDTVRISVNDTGTEVQSKQAVIVPANGSKTETFTLKLTTSGDHAITVGIYKGTAIVRDPDGKDLTGGSTVKVEKKKSGPGFSAVVAVAALAAALVAVVAYRRRR